MATKLSVINAALFELGHTSLTDTGEAVESGRVLNAIYDRVVAECLQVTPWDFAIAFSTPASTGPSAAGYDHVFAKPTDWIETDAIAHINTDFSEPVLAYSEDRRFWAADTGHIIVRYVSNDTGAGGLDIARWPAPFTRYVELELANQACMRLVQSKELKDQIVAERDMAKANAIALNSFSEPWPTYTATNSKSRVIHGALIALGDLGKVSIRNVDVRRAIGRVYDRAIEECLSFGPWNFAIETLAAEADTGPSLGYTHVFMKPTDWVKTEALALNSTFENQLLAYYEDARFWSADTGHIYARYISNDTGHGLEYARWPSSFQRYAELELACQVFDDLSIVIGQANDRSRVASSSDETIKALERLLEQKVDDAENFRTRLVKQRDEARQSALALESFQEPWPTFTATNSKARVIHGAQLALGDMGKVAVRNVDFRRALNRVYDRTVEECLTLAPWNFAMETLAAEADTGPDLGYTHVFIKPSTWLKTEALSLNSSFSNPLLSYYEDARFWAADTGHIYARYVSSDTGQGLEYAKWPPTFTRYVELALACQIFDEMNYTGALASFEKEHIEAFKERLLKQKAEAMGIAAGLESFKAPWPAESTGTSRANIINAALIDLGDLGKVSIQGEDARRALGRVYTEVVGQCLASGSWNFAMETVQADADTGVAPAFGYTEVFAKPTDWVRTIGVSADEHFSFPLIHYYDDVNFWSADTTPIYVRYVSDDTGLGLELSRWPEGFRRFVELELAVRVAKVAAPKVEGGIGILDRLKEDRDKARKRALNVDAMDEPTKFAPPGSWTLSRGGMMGRGDRGSRGSLIG